SRSDRAGVIFPVGHLHRDLRITTSCRIYREAPVFLAAVLQNLLAELLNGACANAALRGHSRIEPQHIIMAVVANEEFCQIFRNVTIPGGGVLPAAQCEFCD
ncbi:histone-fold-containing protein, partial [Piedraia hortae CBS 480.64]